MLLRLMCMCIGFLAQAAILVCLGGRPAFASPPAYAGVYVIVDPYSATGMTFLGCAAAAAPAQNCDSLSSSHRNFLNAFTGVSNASQTTTPAANGILLRVPWCGFQTGAAPGQEVPTLGECHYQVWGASGTGAIFAGRYTDGTDQLYPAGLGGNDPQSGVDAFISNLSLCSGTYDTGSACATSVLDNALSYIVKIANNMPAGSPLKLSVSLMAGQYTPTSVMGEAPTMDFPQPNGEPVPVCSRQPLAWHTSAVSPTYVTSAYERDYIVALAALSDEIHRVSSLNGNVIKLNILKESAITSNSLEFDIAARPNVIATAADPDASNPPQGGQPIKCPDHYIPPEDAVTALLNAYAKTGSTRVMSDAYEYTFGFIMGYEEGLASHTGIASSALLSIPIKGQQTFAHVDCGVAGSETACESDPTTVTDYIYDWDEYYFWKFTSDVAIFGTPATTAAAAGYAKACSGATCLPASLSTISPAEMSVVYTGLNVTAENLSYTDQPECWLNNTTAANDYALRLYSTSTKYTTQSIAGTGVILGWQTQTDSGRYCTSKTSGYHLSVVGIKNGGQYFEIEPDAAAESDCDPDLSATLSDLVGTGNTFTSCYY